VPDDENRQKRDADDRPGEKLPEVLPAKAEGGSELQPLRDLMSKPLVDQPGVIDEDDQQRKGPG